MRISPYIPFFAGYNLGALMFCDTTVVRCLAGSALIVLVAVMLFWRPKK